MISSNWKSLLFLPLALVSCSSLEESNDLAEDVVKKINIVFEPLAEAEDVSRAIPTYNGSTYSSTFFNTDTLGIFSLDAAGKQKTYQLTFPLSDVPAEGASSFSFDGGGWYMSTNYQYQAYAPYDYNNKDAKALPLNFIGQKQKGKDNMDLLGPFYFVTSAKASPDPSTHELSLSMGFRITVARIVLQMPATASYKKLYLVTDGDFALQSTYNLETETIGENLLPSKGMCLNLESVSASAGEEIMFFMCVCPVDLTGKTLDIVLVDSSDNKYVASYNGKKAFNAARAKGISYADFANGFALNNSYALPNVPETIDGISGSAPDFITVGGSTNSFD